MARYRYAGPGPVEDISSGEVIRPGDVREFGEEPAWGPWELIEDAREDAGSDEKAPGATEAGAQTPGAQSPAPKGDSPAPSGSAPAAAGSAPAKTEGM